MGIYREEGGLIFSRIETKTPVLRPVIQSNHWSWCRLYCDKNRKVGAPNSQVVSIKRTADGRRKRCRKVIDLKREKYRAKNGSMRNASTDLKGATFVTLKTQHKRTYQKGKLESNEQSKEGG